MKDSSDVQSPIYVINGKVFHTDSARKIIPRLKQKYIKSLRVVPGKKAALVFGEKARGGAIEYKIPDKKKAFHDLLKINPADSLQNLAGKIYNVADQQPVLKEGLKKLEEKVTYPQKCKQAGIEGRVLVQIIVNKNGQPENPKIIKGLGHGCDKEAIRIAKQARFKPGKINNKPANVKYLLPVIFSMHGKQR